MAPIERVDYVILYVSSLDASIRFYREVLGLEHRFTQNGYAEFGTRPTRFALYERALLSDLIGSVPEPGGPGGEVCFVVDDVDAEAVRLAEAGVRILSGPVDRPWGHRTLHIADPDGHVLELAQQIPRTVERP